MPAYRSSSIIAALFDPAVPQRRRGLRMAVGGAVMALLVAALAGCDADFNDGIGAPSPPPSATPTPIPASTRVAFSFARELQGWAADTADYSRETAPRDFSARYADVPAPLRDRSGYLVEATNRSDDLFMYIWRGVSGLVPGQRYRVEGSATIATNVPPGLAGTGGSPGESVTVKIGASPVAPRLVTQADGYRTTNFDKGNQAAGGAHLAAVGHIAQDRAADGFQLKTLATTRSAAPLVTADAEGRLWLVIGTDSGFEGPTRLFYLDGSFTLSPA